MPVTVILGGGAEASACCKCARSCIHLGPHRYCEAHSKEMRVEKRPTTPKERPTPKEEWGLKKVFMKVKRLFRKQ